ncbi:uncharacterized protein N7484_011725 [Penicillium longicatenatum]|uniref:uncharacterized protein n=1 Tax=Penicillium longicatenatum TaxID=1561947 RepID=UPI00254949E2|nr:uncharacterized protein N7484_011725 [Penicillium longicatenatum]KAJ5631625.1 hypothetical protein N7484_011725 [Penicillium longicatenatum]
MASVEVEAVQVYRGLVDNLLDRAAKVKTDKQIEPPLTEALLGDRIWQLPVDDKASEKPLNQQTQFAAVEIAFREKFYHILASTSINDPSFIHIWNLLDLVSIFSDNEQCEPGLIFWLIEELLDSQTIDGCRKVFDYLESRRERNIKKHFKQKSLIILRSCNELLRRLSRAEDTVFCGRVFIFLFQSFPLGDKSSVNLRGEFHTENVTTYDEIVKSTTENDDGDTSMTDGNDGSATPDGQPDQGNKDDGATPEIDSRVPKVIFSRGRKDKPKEKVDLDALYPIFWSLQSYFSAPSKMFDAERFASFKSGLEATLHAFKNINTDLENQGPARSEDTSRSHKRKRGDEAEVGTSFNPKYLTSRDLFDLEVSDTAFRRHVLVQALILLDFMLSLTSKSKGRLADLTNKSVLYGFVLSEDDAKWVANMRKSIEGYLQQGNGGKFYYRMVDTVLSRDKNWVRWKAEGCPPIERPAISVPDYMKARDEARKTYFNRRLRPSPMGALDFKFLSGTEALANIERLKESDRYSVPTVEVIMKNIMNDEMDIDMAMTDEDKEAAIRAKSSKTWRILRLAAKSKLSAFDKIDDGKNLEVLFEAPALPTDTPQATEGADDDGNEDIKDAPEEIDEEAQQAQETAVESKDVTDVPEQEPNITSDDTVINQGADIPSAASGDKPMEDSTT